MRYIHTLILTTSLMCSVFTQGQSTFSIMSYNIENAFDTIHDEGKNDYDYLPGGEKGWSTYRLF